MTHGGDTIAAIATGVGEAGIAVVRVSGAEALAVAERVFRPRRRRPVAALPSHSITYGTAVDPGDGQVLDEALLAVMRAPRSYTREDVVELHCHGGPAAVRRVLAAVLQAGVRLAEPGEFTRRAFLNGRLDLAQAEAVIDIIRAKTDRAMGAAVAQLSGLLSTEVRRLRGLLLQAMVHLEADIDFPEEHLDLAGAVEMGGWLGEVAAGVRALVASARSGRILRDGARTVIAGRPNVGKSSLLNRLVRESRAIVSATPGTTRDVIEEWVNLGGIPVVLADTAGIRAAGDELEQQGVERSQAAMARADLVLVVVDGAVGLSDEDLAVAAACSGKARVGVVNKADLPAAAGFPAQRLAEALGGARVLAVSARTGSGMDRLEAAIVELVGSGEVEPGADQALVTRVRHERALARALEHATGAQGAVAAGIAAELVAIDVRGAYEALGEVTGETADDALLDQIFSQFCIGK